MKHRLLAVGFGLLISLATFAADVPISGLPAGAAITGTEEIPAVQSAATVKTTPAAVRTYVLANGAALTRTSDTNVTLTLGGSPTTSLLNAASITAGWTGTLAVSRGGIGVGTLTGIAKGNGTSAFTAAASSDITGTFSGTCNSTTFLRGDGSCQTPAGSVTQTNATAFQPTCTGFASCPWPAGSAFYSITGNITCVYIRNNAGTSNSTGFTITIPAAARPRAGGSLGLWGYTAARDNGPTRVVAGYRVGEDGVITFYNGIVQTNAASWTASGSKGLDEDMNVCFANS